MHFGHKVAASSRVEYNGLSLVIDRPTGVSDRPTGVSDQPQYA